MAKTPEGIVKDAVKKTIKEFEKRHGVKVYTFWPVQMGFGAATLDMLGCVNGRAFAVETKAPGKRPTERQKLCIDDMESAGMTVFVIDNEDSAVGGLTLWLETMLDVHP